MNALRVLNEYITLFCSCHWSTFNHRFIPPVECLGSTSVASLLSSTLTLLPLSAIFPISLVLFLFGQGWWALPLTLPVDTGHISAPLGQNPYLYSIDHFSKLNFDVLCCYKIPSLQGIGCKITKEAEMTESDSITPLSS